MFLNLLQSTPSSGIIIYSADIFEHDNISSQIPILSSFLESAPQSSNFRSSNHSVELFIDHDSERTIRRDSSFDPLYYYDNHLSNEGANKRLYPGGGVQLTGTSFPLRRSPPMMWQVGSL